MEEAHEQNGWKAAAGGFARQSLWRALGLLGIEGPAGRGSIPVDLD